VLRDIRELVSRPEEYAAELQRRWGGLLSYRYIGRRHGSMNLGPADDTVTVRQDMRNGAGGLLLAVLGIASPEGGLVTDLEAVPNPVVHSCQVLDPGIDVSRFEVITEDLKRGRQMAYSRSRIVDADRPNRVLALTEGQGISIGIPPEGLQKMSVDPIAVDDSPDLPPLWQVFGGHIRPDGTWAIPELSAEVASPDAALHIGPQFAMLEAAAMSRVVELLGSEAILGISSHVMFVARGKNGPFRFEAEVVDGAGDTVAARTLVYDEGANDKLITAASHVFRAAGNTLR
jgi:acyl-coenzyme A thioesterase PaaI-like protein